MDREIKQYVDDQIRFHIHDGNQSQRIDLDNIFGTFLTSTSAPAGVPSSVFGQIVVYNGSIYMYDTLNNKWVSSSGALFDYYTTVGNTTTTETDLYSSSIIGNTLANNGDKLEIEYGGSFVSSGTATRQLRIKFAGTTIFDTGTLTLSLSSAWTAYATIIRVSATTIRYMISLTTQGAALAAYTNSGELAGLTLANANILKITGQAAGVGAATNDILALLGNVRKVSAA